MKTRYRNDFDISKENANQGSIPFQNELQWHWHQTLSRCIQNRCCSWPDFHSNSIFQLWCLSSPDLVQQHISTLVFLLTSLSVQQHISTLVSFLTRLSIRQHILTLVSLLTRHLIQQHILTLVSLLTRHFQSNNIFQVWCLSWPDFFFYSSNIFNMSAKHAVWNLGRSVLSATTSLKMPQKS